jgi:hypothetical protein
VIQCPTCKAIHEDGVRFCPNDGTPLTETSAQGAVPTPTGPQKSKNTLQLPVMLGQRYRLEEYRGGGGMARVYRAVDVTLERTVAVKLINQELRAETEFDARFQREARVASQLADPHIVVVHDFGLDTTHGPFLVMEYLQGQSLRERLMTDGPLPFKACLQLSAQLMLALLHAHSKGIVHRDIKPDNIFLLNQSGVRLHVRVLDFGIARILKHDDPGKGETLTSPGAVLGTPRYMSPEQLAGQPLDARTDLYSAALVIHESLTGQLPYVSSRKLTELCPEVTPPFQELLEQCLRPNPNDRPPSAVEVYLRLQELGKASGILLLPPGAMDKLLEARRASKSGSTTEAVSAATVAYQAVPSKAPSGRRTWLIGGALLGLAALGLLVKLLFFSGSRPPNYDDESVLNLSYGEDEATVQSKLKLPDQRGKVGEINPVRAWEGDARPEYLGHLLQKTDLGLTEEELTRVDARLTPDGKTCMLFYEGRLRALVTFQPKAATSMRVQVGDTLARATDAYSDMSVGDLDPRTHRRLCRIDNAGIGFEVVDHKIRAIVLYPPVWRLRNH